MIRLTRVRYIAPGHGEVRYTSPSCEVPLPLRRCQAGISKGGEAPPQGTSSPLVSGAKEKRSLSAAQPGGSQGGFQLRGSREGMGEPLSRHEPGKRPRRPVAGAARRSSGVSGCGWQKQSGVGCVCFLR